MSRKRVLVVEDEALIRLIVAETLSDAGYEVIEAETGDRAVALLGVLDRVDLLFTDMQMPGENDGNAVAAFAKARHPGLPVIYATGRPDSLTADIAAGDMFMRKPFGVAEVVAVVMRVLPCDKA